MTSTDMQWFDVFQHWFYTGALAFMGVLFVFRPACFAATSPYCRGVRADADVLVRIMEASARRKNMENVSPRLGYFMAAASFILAFVSAITWQQPALWYALDCLAMAAATTVAFMQIRNAQKRRVALLAPRTPSAVIHPAWSAVSLMCAMTPLVDIWNPALRLTACIVAAASLGIALIAWRATMMPAIIEGVDIPAERFVDERLRAQRSSRVLVIAMIVPFVYLAQTSVVHSPVFLERLVHTAFEEATVIAWLVFMLVLNRSLKRAPAVTEWSAQAS